MAFTKITNADITGKGVVGLPDVPGLSTGAMQAKFDELALDVIIPAYNQLIDLLNGMGVANYSKITDPTDNVVKSLQMLANDLKTYIDTHDATKADKATTIAGYGITDAYTKSETDTALAGKADKATTLAGYGITDAYTKTQVDNSLAGKVDKVAGKGLSTNDYDNTEKGNVASNTAARHTHTNKVTLDAIDATTKGKYDALVTLLNGIIEVETTVSNDNTKIPTGAAVVAYVSGLGGGDMLKSVYDTNDDGTVDSADYATSAGDSSKLGGKYSSFYAEAGDLQTLFGDVATYQSTATALRNYAVGDFMIYQNNFYEVTQAIASGGTIVPNTNVTKTTVGAVLTVLGASSGQHVIEDPSGTSMTPRTNLAFVDSHITDNALDNKTEVEIAKEVTEAAFDALNPQGTEYDGAYLMEVAGATPLTADMVGYDGGTVKGKLDELDGKVNRGSVSVTADGVETFAALIGRLYAACDYGKVNTNSSIDYNSSGDVSHFTVSKYSTTRSYFSHIDIETKVQTTNIKLASSATFTTATTSGTTDNSSVVPLAGLTLTLNY